MKAFQDTLGIVRPSARLAAAGLICFVIGFIARGCFVQPDHAAPSGVAVKAQIWTCSMHPQIRQPGPGLCPLCAMDLVPVGDRQDDNGRPVLNMSESARKIASIRTAPVERRFAEIKLRLSGKVQLDETRVAYIAPRVPGRIDRLYADYTGVQVKKGDPLADIYSPELLAAQQELIQAAGAVQSIGKAGSAGFESAKATLESSREKLRLLQLLPEQIDEIEKSGKPRDRITFFSPLEGVVLEKMDAFEGMYVETGMKLFTLADLGRVWIMLDAYESDLAWLKYGQEVEFEVDAWPGESFSGRIAFISPTVDPETRTVKVRVNAGNSDSRLKPEMFARAYVHASITADGKLVQPDLAGKWISPVHPEVISNEPGECGESGKPLVQADSLGYAKAEDASVQAPLVIPASAPLITGKRAVVYVSVTGSEGSFEGREVVLGPKAGNHYLVRSGLKEGELVVVNGAFKIDSSLQIQGLSSMMQPAAEDTPAAETLPGRQALCPVMGGAVNPELYADYGGFRVYFCCAGCREPFLKEADRYLEEMRSKGIRIEETTAGQETADE